MTSSSDPWGFRARTPIHLSREARHVRTAAGAGLLPLGEAKLAGLLDPRAATWDGGPVRPPTAAELRPALAPQTRWWVPADLVAGAVRRPAGARLARRLPDRVHRPDGAHPAARSRCRPAPTPTRWRCSTRPTCPCCWPRFASLPIDYVARAKSGGHNLSLFKIEQLPVPGACLLRGDLAGHRRADRWGTGRSAGWSPSSGWCAGLAPLASELGLDDVPARPVAAGPGRSPWPTSTPLHAHLLGWTTSDLEHVLGTLRRAAGRGGGR